MLNVIICALSPDVYILIHHQLDQCCPTEFIRSKGCLAPDSSLFTHYHTYSKANTSKAFIGALNGPESG